MSAKRFSLDLRGEEEQTSYRHPEDPGFGLYLVMNPGPLLECVLSRLDFE